MQIHYFQRYHSKENVDTSNTMLMLSRLYNYNADKFFARLCATLGFSAITKNFAIFSSCSCQKGSPKRTALSPYLMIFCYFC